MCIVCACTHVPRCVFVRAHMCRFVCIVCVCTHVPCCVFVCACSHVLCCVFVSACSRVPRCVFFSACSRVPCCVFVCACSHVPCQLQQSILFLYRVRLRSHQDWRQAPLPAQPSLWPWVPIISYMRVNCLYIPSGSTSPSLYLLCFTNSSFHLYCLFY